MSCNPTPRVFFGDRPKCPLGQWRKRKLGNTPPPKGCACCRRYQTGGGQFEESNGVLGVVCRVMMAGVTSW